MLFKIARAAIRKGPNGKKAHLPLAVATLMKYLPITLRVIFVACDVQRCSWEFRGQAVVKIYGETAGKWWWQPVTPVFHTGHGSTRSCCCQPLRENLASHSQLQCNGAVLHFDSADLILDNDAGVDVPEAP